MRNSSFPVQGDGVIVTGAARGIGAATVANLVAQGIHVIAADSNGEMLQETLKKIDPSGALTVAVTADVTSEAECQKIANAAACSRCPYQGFSQQRSGRRIQYER